MNHLPNDASLRNNCPRSGGDQNLFFLDFVSPTKFDNSYFKTYWLTRACLTLTKFLLQRVK
ncbi:putative peroxidase [Rosa chinensis]|uniref:Putative peroxidase n=1 Tax=Rosa chinensis TaxID=74649 RepID=A0A2P6P618_ROSCH|nr:putative peroxidase [Rosa chinensis]